MFKQITFKQINTVIFFTFFITSVYGQEANNSPIPFELMVGNKSMYYQHVLNKEINSSKWSIFNISSFDAKYKDNSDYVFVVSNLLTYQLKNRFALGVGGEVQQPGSYLIVGAQYVYANPELLLVVYPSINMNKKTQLSQFSLVEFKPLLGKYCRLYIRVQGLIVIDEENYHRGYQQYRLGIIKNTIQFGFAANFDQFSNNSIKTSNYGLFFRLQLQ